LGYSCNLQKFPKCGSTIREPQNHDGYEFDDGSLFINAPSASFADVFFTSRHGKRNTKCLVAIQCKLLEMTAMTKKILNDEVKKNEDARKDHREALGIAAICSR